ncbi:hypothetical protein ERHA55_51730 (plasmid) [Erwinia rhapontici]|nr:hypothetical protein ERHA55_51730 [Erwinia rhapontici]
MSLVDLNSITGTRHRRAGTRWYQRLNPGLTLAWAVMILVILWALVPGWFTDWSSTEGVAGAQRLAPQAGHWLGTDQLGRDVYARIVWGASHSLSGALVAVALGLTVGTLLGVTAGSLAGVARA